MEKQRIPGSFKLAYQSHASDIEADPLALLGSRAGRILASIQQDLDEGAQARVRQILCGPQELYRLEVERPDLAYQRITILDRETLETLLEQNSEQTLRQQFRFRS